MKKLLSIVIVAGALLLPVGCASKNKQQVMLPQIVSVSNVGTTNMIVGKTNVQAMLVIVEVQPQVVQLNTVGTKKNTTSVQSAVTQLPTNIKGQSVSVPTLNITTAPAPVKSHWILKLFLIALSFIGGFVGGVLVGRRNPKKVEAVITEVEKIETAVVADVKKI